MGYYDCFTLCSSNVLVNSWYHLFNSISLKFLCLKSLFPTVMQRGKIKLDDLLWLIQACMASIEEATRACTHIPEVMPKIMQQTVWKWMRLSRGLSTRRASCAIFRCCFLKELTWLLPNILGSLKKRFYKNNTIQLIKILFINLRVSI